MVYWNFLSFIKVTYWEVQRWGLSSINVRKNYFSKMIENNFNRVLFSIQLKSFMTCKTFSFVTTVAQLQKFLSHFIKIWKSPYFSANVTSTYLSFAAFVCLSFIQITKHISPVLQTRANRHTHTHTTVW